MRALMGCDILLGMGSETAPIAVPMRFAGVDLLVQATPTTVVGSQQTSAVDKVADAYQRAETTIIGVAASVAETIRKLNKQRVNPKLVEVQFGLSVTVEGDIVVMKGSAEATLAVTLTYDAA
jgi:hypothetical protein